jgi:hypothetical protein
MSTGDGGFPTEASKETWITLFPEQTYILDATIRSVSGDKRGWGQFFVEKKSDASEKAATLKEQNPMWKWPFAYKLFDGEVYTIGVSEEARVKQWMVGDLQRILESRKQGVTPRFRGEVIGFEVRRRRDSKSRDRITMAV